MYDLPWMQKKKRGRERKWERREEEWNDEPKAESRRLLYRPRRLFLPRGAGSNVQTRSAISPRSRRTSWAAGRPGKSGRLGEISALRARTIFRLSLRECQPDRERNGLKRTPSASGSRPWSRGREGRGAGRSFLGAVLVHAQVALHCFQRQRRAESIARAFRDVLRVTRDVTAPASRGVVAEKREKSRTRCDHAGSPFGRL